MKKFILNLLFVSLIISPLTHAQSLSGLWFGTYTFKNSHDCHRTGGCMHLLSAETTLQANNIYNAEFSPPIDTMRSITAKNDNGQIILPIKKDHRVNLTCEKNKPCRFTYEDDRLGVVLTKIN